MIKWVIDMCRGNKPRIVFCSSNLLLKHDKLEFDKSTSALASEANSQIKMKRMFVGNEKIKNSSSFIIYTNGSKKTKGYCIKYIIRKSISI
jgi:hypothetical protein